MGNLYARDECTAAHDSARVQLGEKGSSVRRRTSLHYRLVCWRRDAR
jgi:hypothetical protein